MSCKLVPYDHKKMTAAEKVKAREKGGVVSLGGWQCSRERIEKTKEQSCKAMELLDFYMDDVDRLKQKLQDLVEWHRTREYMIRNNVNEEEYLATPHQKLHKGVKTSKHQRVEGAGLIGLEMQVHLGVKKFQSGADRLLELADMGIAKEPMQAQQKTTNRVANQLDCGTQGVAIYILDQKLEDANKVHLALEEGANAKESQAPPSTMPHPPTQTVKEQAIQVTDAENEITRTGQ